MTQAHVRFYVLGYVLLGVYLLVSWLLRSAVRWRRIRRLQRYSQELR